jgi:hypothetical protein
VGSNLELDHLLTSVRRWDTLPDPDALPPKKELILDELYKEIRSTVEEEIHIVQAVFPNPALVMQVFLQRVFAQSVRRGRFLSAIKKSDRLVIQIQQHMEVSLNKAMALSRLSYLRVLQICHSQTSSLVDDLKSRDSAFTSLRSSSSSESSLPGTILSSVPPNQTLTSMLESAMEEMFVPYIEGQRALEMEITNLGELYANYLDRFSRYHVCVLLTDSAARPNCHFDFSSPYKRASPQRVISKTMA